jgi:hypothetical protein
MNKEDFSEIQHNLSPPINRKEIKEKQSKKKICNNCLELQKKVEELEDKLKLNKLNFRSIFDLSEERIEEVVEQYYTESLYMEGKRGIVTFIYSYIVRDDEQNIVYKCIDQDKQIFEYLDESGTVRKDRKANQLFAIIYKHIVKKANKIYRILIDRLYEQYEKPSYNSDSDDDEVLEVIEEELSIDEENKVERIDDQINNAVKLNIDIKKISKNKKIMVEELARMLYI